MSSILGVKFPETNWDELFGILLIQNHAVIIAELETALTALEIDLVITDRPSELIAVCEAGVACPLVVALSNYYLVANNPVDGHIIKRMLANLWGASRLEIFPSNFDAYTVAAAIENMLMS